MRTLTEEFLQTLQLRFDGWVMPTVGDPLRQAGHRRAMYEADTLRHNAATPAPVIRNWVHIAD